MVVLVVMAGASWTAPRWLGPLLVSRSPRCVIAIPTREKVVALTIDDGPDVVHTPEILRVLDAHGATATFFLISGQVPGAESIVRDAVARGHEVGNHLTRDEPSILLSAADFGVALRRADSVLSRFARPIWLRPGGGFYKGAMVDTAERAGYRCALGSVYPYDGHLTWSPLASAYILANTRPGAIIVLHEGGSRGDRTLSILRRVLPELRARGYRVTSLSGLAALAEPGEREGVSR